MQIMGLVWSLIETSQLLKNIWGDNWGNLNINWVLHVIKELVLILIGVITAS